MASLLDPKNRDALIQGLLSFGGGILANNTGHYGQFGPAVGRGIQDFGRVYTSEVQRRIENEQNLKRMQMLEQLQGAQMENYKALAAQRQAETDAAMRAQQDMEHDRGLISGGRPGAAPGAFNPASPMVKPMPMSADVVGTPIPGPAAAPMFDYQQKFPTDFGPGAPVQTPQQTPQPPMPEQQMPQVDITAEPSGASEFLQQAEYWKDLAGRAKTKEFRDIYYQNYRNAFDKYADLTKQEMSGDVWQTVPDAPGVMRRKGSDVFMFNGKPIPAEEVQRMARDNRKAGATNVTTHNTLSTDKKYGESFASNIAKADTDMLEAANKATDLAQRANSIREVIATGKVITGTGADYRLALGKALNLVGMGGDKETIANTEALTVDLARNTLDAIKASGLGSGTGFSNADRDFLEKAAGGKINLEAATIDRLATLAHRAADRSAQKWNSRVKMIPKSALEGTGISRDPIQVPPLFSKPSKQPVIPKGYTVERIN